MCCCSVTLDNMMMSAHLFCVVVLTAAVQVFGLNRHDFSETLQQAVNDMLGSDQYKVS